MNDIGERVADFPAFLELTRDMLTAEIAERQRPLRPAMRPKMRPVEALLGFVAA